MEGFFKFYFRSDGGGGRCQRGSEDSAPLLRIVRDNASFPVFLALNADIPQMCPLSRASILVVTRAAVKDRVLSIVILEFFVEDSAPQGRDFAQRGQS